MSEEEYHFEKIEDRGENSNVPKQYRTWGMVCHISALCVYLGIPIGNILAPLIIWLLKKEESPFLHRQGKEALNFQISFSIYGLIAWVLCFILIGFLLFAILIPVHIIFTVIAAVKANDGKDYQYPLCFRFLK